MAPIHLHQHQTRSIGRSTSYTILFAFLVGSVVAFILIWGFVIPCLRKSGSLPLMRSTTRSLRRRNANDLQRQVQDIASYNPRLESPFPNVSRPDSIILPTWTPTRARSPTVGTNQSLFTPARPDSPYPFIRPSLPKIGSRLQRSTPGALGTDFGDAREYILAIPEPLRVSSRALGHQPVVASPLNTLPDPTNTTVPAGRHSKKLFEPINVQDAQGSECSSTSLKIDEAVSHRKSLSAEICTAEDMSDEEDVDLRLSFQFPEKKEDASPRNDHEDTHDVSPIVSKEKKADSAEHNASVAAMHRLRTYRSLVGAPPPEPLSRAGTLSRPKTPVATIRNIFDQKTENGKATNKTVSRNNTISTLFRTVSGSSDDNCPRSPVTSPLKASPERLRVSSSSLVPTPLRIKRSPEVRSASSPMQRGSKFREQLDYTERFPAGMSEDDIDTPEGPAVQAIPNRSRPAPLTLAANGHLPLSQQSPLFTGSPVGARLMPPQHRSQLQSMRASSVYSYDTLGHSIDRTPATPDFPNTGVLRSVPFSPYVPSTIGETHESSGKGTEANLITAEERRGHPRTTVDTANQKVENWNVEGMEWDFDASPSSSIKCGVSTIGPGVESRQGLEDGGEEEGRKSLHSTISTEINPSEARLSVVVGSPLRASGCNGVIGAPEGGNWL